MGGGTNPRAVSARARVTPSSRAACQKTTGRPSGASIAKLVSPAGISASCPEALATPARNQAPTRAQTSRLARTKPKRFPQREEVGGKRRLHAHPFAGYRLIERQRPSVERLPRRCTGRL